MAGLFRGLGRGRQDESFALPSRRRQRQRNSERRCAEAGAGGTSAVEFLREEQSIGARRRKEGLKLAGLITSAVGLALMVFIGAVERGSSEPSYLVGIIPLFIGVALLIGAHQPQRLQKLRIVPRSGSS